MSGGAFTDSLDVAVGDPTKASDYDKVADNTEFTRELAEIDHDFDISTGTGYHNVITKWEQTVSANLTLPANYNALSVGKVSVASGVKVSVPGTCRWVIV